MPHALDTLGLLPEPGWGTTGKRDHFWFYKSNGATVWLETYCGKKMDKAQARPLKGGRHPCIKCTHRHEFRTGERLWLERWNNPPYGQKADPLHLGPTRVELLMEDEEDKP